jgi:hypothetical protein
LVPVKKADELSNADHLNTPVKDKSNTRLSGVISLSILLE